MTLADDSLMLHLRASKCGACVHSIGGVRCLLIERAHDGMRCPKLYDLALHDDDPRGCLAGEWIFTVATERDE